jgi:hypothetical protein
MGIGLWHSGECHGGAIFALLLLSAPLILVALAAPRNSPPPLIAPLGPLGPWPSPFTEPPPLPLWSRPLLWSRPIASQGASRHGSGDRTGHAPGRIVVNAGERLFPAVVASGEAHMVGDSHGHPNETALSWNSVVAGAGNALSFTVDVSSVGCGCTASLYLVSMPSEPSEVGDCPEVTNTRSIQV